MADDQTPPYKPLTAQKTSTDKSAQAKRPVARLPDVQASTTIVVIHFDGRSAA